MSTTRTLAAALAVAALAAAPAAQAKPADMHASVAQAAAKAQQKQDLRSPDARDAAIHLRRSGLVVNAQGESESRITSPTPAGQPTWAVNPQPITPAAQGAAWASGPMAEELRAHVARRLYAARGGAEASNAFRDFLRDGGEHINDEAIREMAREGVI